MFTLPENYIIILNIEKYHEILSLVKSVKILYNNFVENKI